MKKEIILIDAFNIVATGLKLLIEKEKDFNVHVVSSFDQLFALLESKKPDLIILNLLLPRDEAVSISRKLNAEYSELYFMVIASAAEEYTILECVFNGAKGIIWSETSSEEFIGAINTVLEGSRYLKIPESQVIKKVVQHAYEEHLNETTVEEISHREQEVLKLFVQGLSYKEIGANLEISPRTVESHKNNILAKLNLSSVNEMIKYAIKHRLIEF